MTMESLLNKIGQINNTATTYYGSVLEKVMKTVIEMLKDRGNTIVNDCRTIGDITFKMQENDYIISGECDGVSTFVYFHNEERIGVKQLRVWNENITNEDIIIVSLEGPTAFTKKEAENNYKNVQFFTFKQLCVNITRHDLVPKHEKIKNEDLKIEASKLPKLYTNDAISQYYNYKEGDLIRITRTVGYPEPVFFYRTVCISPYC